MALGSACFGCYPFGMMMVGRKWNGGEYRYGFNGKENDNDVKGDGNEQDYGMRIYDSRIGRFSSLDPLFRTFPNLSPFQFASNSPIANIDLDGSEAKYFNIVITETFDGKGKLTKSTRTTTYDATKEAGWHWSGIIPSKTTAGDLGNGTLYQVTKVKNFAPTATGVEHTEISSVGAIYVPEPPKPDREHPVSSLSVGIQIFGNGYDPDEAPTSKANSNMHVISFNFSEFQELIEPVLVGLDAKSASSLKVPSLDELIIHAGEAGLDHALKELESKWKEKNESKAAKPVYVEPVTRLDSGRPIRFNIMFKVDSGNVHYVPTDLSEDSIRRTELIPSKKANKPDTLRTTIYKNRAYQ